MAVTVGFALVCTVAPIVGKRVFLRVVSTIPTVMHGMTTAAATVKKKRPLAVQKVRLSPVQKQLLIEAPPQTLPKGRESHREVPLWVSLRGEGTNLLYTMCLILFVFLMCYVEIRVLVFLILLGWSVLIVASHIIRGIWSMG